MPEEEKELIGTSIGNYEVTGFIGAGGMGSVYLGEHPDIGKKVAIKILASELSDNPQMAERFIFEAKAVNQIEHDNIVEIYDFGRMKDNRLYYTMELLKGMPLDDHMAERRFPLDEAFAILHQVASALSAVHAQGIVHRDLKPENIFVNDKGGVITVKLLDFGIAKLLDKDASQGFKTATGVIMGTPYYMSPEQAKGEMELISPQSDIYSLGIILYQMLSGELPISGNSMGAILVNQITQSPKPLPEFIDNFPQAVWQVMAKSLAKEPGERQATIAEFADTFSQAASLIAPSTIYGEKRPIGLTHPPLAGASKSSIAGVVMEDMAPKSKMPIVLVVLFLLLASGGALYYFKFHKKQSGDMDYQKNEIPTSPMTPLPLVAMSPEKPIEKKVIVVHLTIKADQPKVKVIVQIPGKSDFFYETPFTLNLTKGQKVTLKAQKAKYEELIKIVNVLKDDTIILAMKRLPKGRRTSGRTRRHPRTMKKSLPVMTIMKPAVVVKPMPVMKKPPMKSTDTVLKIY
jgi:serine/threonine protein kinase